MTSSGHLHSCGRWQDKFSQFGALAPENSEPVRHDALFEVRIARRSSFSLIASTSPPIALRQNPIVIFRKRVTARPDEPSE
jgi:hypothetical protein